MLLKSQRTELVAFGKRMVASGLTVGTGGNLSIRGPEAGLVAMTPSGIDYDSMCGEDIVVVDMDGAPVDGARQPSSEWRFHLALYRRRKDIGAIVHTHSVYATTLACLRWELPAVHYLVACAGIKVPVAPYATFGTEDLSRSITETIGSYNAVLLANHGLVAVGPTLPAAFAVAQEIEFVAQVYYLARCAGDPVRLNDEEMSRVLSRFKTYGQAATGDRSGAGLSRTRRPSRS